MSYTEETPAEPAAAASHFSARWQAFAWYRTLFVVGFFALLFCIPLMSILAGASFVVVVATFLVPFISLQWLLMRLLTRLIPACREPRSRAT